MDARRTAVKTAPAAQPVAPRLKSQVRSALRRFVAGLARRRWIVRLAKPLLAMTPSLNTRLRRMAAAAPVRAEPRALQLGDAQLRVFIDLRNAGERTSGNP